MWVLLVVHKLVRFPIDFQVRTDRGIEEVEVLLEESGVFQVETLNLRA